MRRGGWSLVEVLVVVGTITLLIAMATPSVGWARRQAKQISCASQLHGIGQAFATYASAHRFYLPPFAFSDMNGNLPLSGHWGGTEPQDPTLVGRDSTALRYVNLWAMVAENIIQPQQLVCPSADRSLKGNGTTLFPYTARFSTYCLRFPSSKDLFSSAPGLAYYPPPYSSLLGIYRYKPGGQEHPVAGGFQTVPLVRMDRVYRPDKEVWCGNSAQRAYDAGSDALLADEFWQQDYSMEAPKDLGAPSCPVRWAWCHGKEFNVLYGGGAAGTLSDDGTVAANSNSPTQTLEDTGMYYGKYAERVWQFFDQKR